MIWRYGLLFLVLLTAVYADCIGYQESFDVRVLDGKERPVEGAEVSITYDRGASFGEQYFTTPIAYTNAEGKVHYTIINQGTTTRKIDCDIDIQVSAGGSAKKKTVVANEHGPTVDVVLDDVYLVRFYVRDHFNAPIPNATVNIGKKTNMTNEDGYVRYALQEGDYEYFASYLEAKDAGIITIKDDDLDYQVNFPYYKVKIDVMDDFGEPLDALVTMYNETFQLENGHFENNRSFGSEISYEIDYKGLVKSGTIVTAIDPTATVVYDIHAPTIEKAEPELKAGAPTKLIVTVTEPGKHPSGVDVTSMKVRYRLEPADPTTPWNEAVVFASGYNIYTAQFSDLPPDSIVQCVIELKDMAGNRASREVKFSTLAVEEPPDDTQNQTTTQEDGETEQEIPIFYSL